MKIGTRSFAICSESIIDPSQLNIKKLHLNIWHLPKDLIIDIGIQFSFKTQATHGDELKFILYTPFWVESEEISPLYSLLKEQSVTQLIFNDNVKKLNMSCNDIAALITFSTREPLLIFKPIIKKLSKHKIEITIKTSEIIDDEFKEKDFDNCYIRFRFNSSFESKNICKTPDGGFSNKIFFDIRFNEIRLLPDDEIIFIQKNILPIKKYYVFIIQEYDRNLTLNEKKLEYIRFLEKEHFEAYLKELKKAKNEFIIYYWKCTGGTDSERGLGSKLFPKSINMVTGFEKQKVSFKHFQNGIFVNLFSTGIILGNSFFVKNYGNNFSFSEAISAVSSWINYFFLFIFLISFLYAFFNFGKFIFSIICPFISWIKKLYHRHSSVLKGGE